MNDIFRLAKSFLNYYKKFNLKNIPDEFIKEYYIFSHQPLISIIEFTEWIGINRKTIIENLQKNYKVNVDYFITTYEEELKHIIIYKNLNYKHNQKFIIITSKCFKDICVRSNTIKGNMMRKYYMELDELFKKFHFDKIKNISDENDYLLNNQSKNKLKNEEGIYIWNTSKNSSIFRIGKASNISERISQHNSSNYDKIFPKIIIYSKCSTELENMLKICLKKYSYRGEFYKCGYSKLNLIINDIIEFLNKYNKNCDVKKENIVKFNKKIILKNSKNNNKNSKNNSKNSKNNS
jgi:hypothetical protein